MKRILALLCISVLIADCDKNGIIRDDVTGLPVDNGGTYQPVAHESTASPYGFYIYTPGGYSPGGANYPLLIFLHGAGEVGNSNYDVSTLDKILVTGIPELIANNRWHPPHPMIVVSPQCHERQWDPLKVHGLIEYIVANYQVDLKRIYLTGLSLGGIGAYNYIQEFGDDGYAAAVVPVAGKGDASKASAFLHVPIWAFHGDADPIIGVSNSVTAIKAINDEHPTTKALLTIYPGVGHDSWTRTYDESGMGQESPAYDPFDISIFEWMFRYTK